MNTLNLFNQGLSLSAPSGGLWTRQSGSQWSGWTQFAPALHAEADLRLPVPRPKRRSTPSPEVVENGGCELRAA